MIVALVSVETVLLVLLVLLVAGLLRSHAEILRRLESQREPAIPPSASPERQAGRRAPELAGRTPTGDAIKLSFEGPSSAPTLLAFLTSGCSTCAGFWGSLGEAGLPPGVQTLIVARGSERESPAKLRTLAAPEVPVVMSSQAWEDYAVPGSPYFVLVDQEIRGEGVATTWSALSSLVRDAIEDQEPARPERGRNVEETLAANGIGPDHPSLYPGR